MSIKFTSDKGTTYTTIGQMKEHCWYKGSDGYSYWYRSDDVIVRFMDEFMTAQLRSHCDQFFKLELLPKGKLTIDISVNRTM